MRIAISIQTPDANALVDTRFGRCRYFCIADTADGSRSVADNSAGANSAQGAGFKAVETVAKLGVEAVVTGQLGPKAESALKAAGIPAYAVEGGTVDDALALLAENKLRRIA